jgi:hypothetical protein
MKIILKNYSTADFVRNPIIFMDFNFEIHVAYPPKNPIQPNFLC